MSTERVRHEIKQLIAESDQLNARIRKLSEGVRYVRTQEKSEALYRQLKEARQCLAQAQAFLDGQEPALNTEDINRDGHKGWLRERVAGISRALIYRTEEAVGTQQAQEPERLGGFQGDSWSIPLPDLIGFIRSLAKTGELSVQLIDEKVTLQFDHGELVTAFSSNTPQGQRLGEVLVQMGALTEERLSSFLNIFSSSALRLGEALMRGELVSREVLQEAVERQVQLLFHRLAEADDAAYTFRDGPYERVEGDASLNVTHLLLESARYMDENAA